ncbi:M20/M25/M40 family metallo-hydrolase [Pseudonocardia sp. RS11V-5]|uniref:M20/M25/M40 family metallo-hydrolase n=1 Tax=Pseudonocardia terrae TaxID=2905831 RepID=UPI001E54BF2B|nr:M20/M25/M40 family metallo-hydrolase [Pseudonocardia terrae]MCE3556234.1 M20/M25/M40 family metallo-hydrolase [Pseudonocardia terrae]
MSLARSPIRTRLYWALLAVALVALSACGSGSQTPRPTAPVVDGQLAQQLKGAVGNSGALVHLQELQKIADQNGGNRATPSPGYLASVDYVSGVLRAAGFDVATPDYTLSRRRGGTDGGGGPTTLPNVVTQTRTGDPAHVVMIGAHLDSVKQGPGIVDDGSGVAALLEIATRLGPSPAVRNVVRFGFWGSEESGAQGSKGYVTGLSDADRAKVMLYLNVDMIASPDGGYFVQGGTGDDTSSAGPPGSATVGDVLADQLGSTGVTPQRIPFVGDDETPFVAANIPSAGAENGDRKKKTEEQAQAWGGQAGGAYDPCYHQACDTVQNVNPVVLDHYLHALAGTLAHFATTTDTLP